MAPEPINQFMPLISRIESIVGDAVMVHYLLPTGERRAIMMPSVLQTYGYHHEIGIALAASDRRIRGKRL